MDLFRVARAQSRDALLRAVYDKAVADVEACVQELRDHELAFADGQEKYRNVFRVERTALQAYLVALDDLAALTKPDDPPIRES